MSLTELVSRLNETVFCDTNLEVSPNELEEMKQELLNYPKKHWYWCTYRKCYLLLLYGNREITNKSELGWMEHVDQCAPKIKSFLLKKIGPYFKQLPRIIVLRTLQGGEIPFHIDCNEEQIGTFNPKLRICVSGRKARLEFKSGDDKVMEARPESAVYYMSGAFTHRLINESDEERLTLCLGAPWTHESTEPEFYSILKINSRNAIHCEDIDGVRHFEYAKDWSLHELIPAESQ